jgi:hypothetical protein
MPPLTAPGPLTVRTLVALRRALPDVTPLNYSLIPNKYF